MAEARLISKDLFRSSAFEGFTPAQLAVVVALIVHADDDGVVCCEPDYIRRAFFPLVSRNTAPSLTTIQQVVDKCIARGLQEVGNRSGRKFLRWTNWGEHQPYKKGRKEERKKGAFAPKGTESSSPTATKGRDDTSGGEEPATPEEQKRAIQAIKDGARGGDDILKGAFGG